VKKSDSGPHAMRGFVLFFVSFFLPATKMYQREEKKKIV